MTETRYHRPATIAEAIHALQGAEGDGVVLAGGLVVGSIINQRLSVPGVIVDISRIGALGRIEPEAGGGLVIGALATHDAMMRSEQIRAAAPLLSEIATDIACGRLRNRGTIGGSLCMIGQQGDPATGLIVLGARIRLQGPEGARTLPLEAFYDAAFSLDLKDGEILTEVLVPPPPPRSGQGFTKFGPRGAMDFTLVTLSAGVALAEDGRLAEVRIAINGVAPSVLRATGAEAALAGQAPDALPWEAATAALQDEISPEGDLVYSERHKRRLANVALRRSLETAIARASARAHQRSVAP